MVVEILLASIMFNNQIYETSKLEVIRPFYQMVEADTHKRVQLELKEKYQENTEEAPSVNINKVSPNTETPVEPEKKEIETIVDDSDKGIEIPEEVSAIDMDLMQETYGTLEIPTLNLNTNIRLGATQENVDNYDVCISRQAGYCGGGEPIIIMGHNYNSLQALPDIKIGAKIIVRASYGVYVYEVTQAIEGKATEDGTNIVNKDGKALIKREGNTEYLQLYTCYGETGGRYVVKAKYVKGTKIVAGTTKKEKESEATEETKKSKKTKKGKKGSK